MPALAETETSGGDSGNGDEGLDNEVVDINPPSSRGSGSGPASSDITSVTTTADSAATPSTSGGLVSEAGSGLSIGVVAGAAVGAAVGAAILTFLITFIFFRRKHQKRQRGVKAGPGSGSALSGYKEKVLSKQYLPQKSIGEATGWQKHLPQSADDDTVRNSVKTLFDQVELHVENFYDDSLVVRMTERMREDLLSVDSPQLPESIAALLPRAKSRTALIKHCLLSYIIASISMEDDSVPSLLPSDLIALPRLAHTAEAQNERRQKPAQDQAMSQWRVLSAYVRPSPSQDVQYLAHRDATAHATASTLATAFAPWSSSSTSSMTAARGTTSDNPTRLQNLVEILKSAADVGILLFSQPSSFRYDWSPARASASTSVAAPAVRANFATTPAFLKVKDENATPLDRPLVMIQMS